MSLYPINLELKRKPCAVVGGGMVAWRKVRSLLTADASVTVISPALVEPLAKLAAEKKIAYLSKPYERGDLTEFFLVICCADIPAVNRQAAEDAKRNGALVNTADRSFPSDFTVPAQVSRGDLLLTVSTGGKSPAVSRQIRAELAQLYGCEYGAFLDLVAQLRAEVKNKFCESKQRETFWQQAMEKRTLDLVRQGKLDEAEAEIRNAIGSIGTEP